MTEQIVLTQNYDIDVILPELMFEEMNDVGEDPLLKALPLSYDGNADMVKWDQYENGYGLLSLRGLGGEPNVVPVPGIRQYAVAPGYYGERAVLDETEMTKGRQPGTPNLAIDPTERIAILTQYQAEKSVNRIRRTIADLLRTGEFTNVSPSGGVVHQDRIENYQSITINNNTLPKTGLQLGPGWRSNPTTAQPLNDLMKIKTELEFGTSSEFGPNSTLLVNPAVQTDLLATKQVQETYKDRFGASIASFEQLDQLLLGLGLPKLVPYKKGFYPTVTDAVNRVNFTRIIPDKWMIWLGTRPKGQKLGRFQLTRNLGVSPPDGVPDEPTRVNYRKELEWAEGIYMQLRWVPRMPFRYEFDVGFNGGPVVYFGSAAAGITY